VTNETRRVEVASQFRELGHEFLARDVDDDRLEEMSSRLGELLLMVRSGTPRVRTAPSGSLASFKMAIPEVGKDERHQLFSDSIVTGAANPMGLGGYLWREGDVAVQEVTLGKAFEGAPGRAHGGIIAAIIDETMGLVLAINSQLAFTAQLDIAFVAPAPINVPLTARAWLREQNGRKISIEANVEADGGLIAKATALFISVDPKRFLEVLSPPNQ
jgi:acyl-coenzyme A thioesterase PaaI-like protein